MDLLTAVAVSMLPVSRLRAAAAFKVLRQGNPGVGLSAVAEAVGSPPDLSEVVTHARRAIDEASDLGLDPIAWFDPRYPPLLSCIDDPPPVLWARGLTDIASKPSVAVIGSRAATPYALQVGRRLSAELAERGIVVVSGLARGVDSAAHEGSLDAGGATIAVTGCGLDRVYPQENIGLSRKIASNGLLISELAAGAAPLPEHFPLRNRVISGISLAVVVVEANEKSGSLITAACAARQGRDVMAVPGSVLSGRNRGSHSLLKDGAKVVETADDILEELGWAPGPPVERIGNTRARSMSQDPLLSRMEIGEVYGLDELAEATGIGAARLLPRLMELELLGLVEAPSAGRFVRKLLIT